MTRKFSHSVSLGHTNTQVLESFWRAYDVALKLAEQGYIVTEIKTTASDRSSVWLHPNGKCNRLDSAMHQRGTDRVGRYEIRVTVINGCEVFYRAPGAATWH